MPEKVITNKVLCYVVREGHLLVFRHTDFSYEEVGIQVPGGGVRSGEDPADAALREAREETGLTGSTVVRKLGRSSTTSARSASRSSVATSSSWRCTGRRPNGGRARKTTTASRSPPGSSASGYRYEPRTSCNPARVPS
ncbi:NUDIX hydrolase [Micromonospora sp. DPT]|uniref:NUDIX hydrolase n=1 Tax=Micromonospora sp. DPT TaxID=3142975 RepID=UPI00320814C1